VGLLIPSALKIITCKATLNSPVMMLLLFWSALLKSFGDGDGADTRVMLHLWVCISGFIFLIGRTILVMVETKRKYSRAKLIREKEEILKVVEEL